MPTHQRKWHACSLVEVLVADVARGETSWTSMSISAPVLRRSHCENPLHEPIDVLTERLASRTISPHGDIHDLLGRGVPSEDVAQSGVQSPDPSASAPPVEVKVAASRASQNVLATVAPRLLTTQETAMNAFNAARVYARQAIYLIKVGRNPTIAPSPVDAMGFLEYPGEVCSGHLPRTKTLMMTKRAAKAAVAIAAAVPPSVVAEFEAVGHDPVAAREFAQRHRLPQVAVEAIEAVHAPDAGSDAASDDDEVEPGKCKVCDTACPGAKCRPCVAFIGKTPAAVSARFNPDDLDAAARRFLRLPNQKRNTTQFVKYLADRNPDMAIVPAAAPVARNPCLTCHHNTLKPGTDCAGCVKFWDLVSTAAPDQFTVDAESGDAAAAAVENMVGLRTRLAEYLTDTGITLGAGDTGKGKTAATKFATFLNGGAAPMEIDPVAAGPAADRVFNRDGLSNLQLLLLDIYQVVGGSTERVFAPKDVQGHSNRRAIKRDMLEKNGYVEKIKNGQYKLTLAGVEAAKNIVA